MNAVLLCNRAAAASALQMFNKVVDDCARALKLRPSYAKAILRRARALVQLGRRSEAILDFERYLQCPEATSAAEAKKELAETKASIAREKESDRRRRAEKEANRWKQQQQQQQQQKQKQQQQQQQQQQQGWYSRGAGSRPGYGGGGGFYGASGGYGGYGGAKAGGGGSSQYRYGGGGQRQQQRGGSSSRSSRAKVAEPSHYSVLGVAQDASSAQIKKAYHKLALKFHPDKSKATGAEEKFKKIGAAYGVLSSPGSKRTYDLERQFSRCGV
jgi:tetratricopeptide (TPR) repeat protein